MQIKLVSTELQPFVILGSFFALMGMEFINSSYIFQWNLFKRIHIQGSNEDMHKIKLIVTEALFFYLVIWVAFLHCRVLS